MVGFSKSKDFNDVALIDLKGISGHKIIDVIDHATQNSEGATVKLKCNVEIVWAICQH